MAFGLRRHDAALVAPSIKLSASEPTGIVDPSTVQEKRGHVPAVHGSALRLQLLLTWGQDNTEPDTVVPEVRAAVVAIRRPAVTRVVVPTAPAAHAVRACFGTLRINHTSAG